MKLSELSLGLVSVVAVSLLFQFVTPVLEAPILAMGYLLLVLFVSMRLSYWPALTTAIFSFIALNFLFIEPRYTLQVARLQSLFELIGFLIVSATMVSLMDRLKAQSQAAKDAQIQAEAARHLAESLLRLKDAPEVCFQGSEAIAKALGARVVLVSVIDDVKVDVLVDTDASSPSPDMTAARWVVAHQQAIGPDTGYWQELDYWCIPLYLEEARQITLFLYSIRKEFYTENNLSFLKGLANQISLALDLLYAKKSEQLATQQAEKEVLHNTLLASLSHDFRTPLTTIIGAATSLRYQYANLSIHEQNELFALIESEAISMLDDAENILSLTRVEALGELALNADWQSWEELVGVVLSLCRQRYPSRRFDVSSQSNLPLLFVDAKLMIQAVMNLIENAIKFDNSAEPIRISATVDMNDCVTLSVRDHGVGMAQAQAQLMTKFMRCQPESSQPGFGLGLAICNAIAKVHGGYLKLENIAEGGLRATIGLPIKRLSLV